MEIRQRERLKPLRGAAGFVSNHSSALDAVAMAAGVPIVPAYVEGTFELLPRFRHLPRPAQGALTWGDPLDPRQGEDYDAFITRVEMAVRTLAGPKGMERDEPSAAGSASAEGSNYWY